MPPPNLALLQVDPAGILQWLDDNLLMAGTLANVVNPPGVAWVTIVAPPVIPFPQRAVTTSGRPLDVFTLRSNGAGVHDAVRAYVCNYTAGGVHSVALASIADYCFTINLNGCTFGIGPVAGGSRRVSHANTGGNTLVQRTQTWGEHHVPANSLNIKMLEPAEYRRLGGGGALNATVFGIRTGLVWHFYFQLYTAVGQGNYVVHGVFPISTT
jgi:hypothetical protein